MNESTELPGTNREDCAFLNKCLPESVYPYEKQL